MLVKTSFILKPLEARKGGGRCEERRRCREAVGGGMWGWGEKYFLERAYNYNPIIQIFSTSWFHIANLSEKPPLSYHVILYIQKINGPKTEPNHLSVKW